MFPSAIPVSSFNVCCSISEGKSTSCSIGGGKHRNAWVKVVEAWFFGWVCHQIHNGQASLQHQVTMAARFSPNKKVLLVPSRTYRRVRGSRFTNNPAYCFSEGVFPALPGTPTYFERPYSFSLRPLILTRIPSMVS